MKGLASNHWRSGSSGWRSVSALPYFKKEGSALNSLKGVLDAVSHQEFDYAVEFRHNSWLDESRKEIDAAALEVLRERKVANVLIDGPGLHLGVWQTANHSYLRFHGRNYDIWHKGEKEDDHRRDRYDYLYKRDQLEPWMPQIIRSKDIDQQDYFEARTAGSGSPEKNKKGQLKAISTF